MEELKFPILTLLPEAEEHGAAQIHLILDLMWGENVRLI